MSKKIDIELVQDKYTNFIVYDGSDRTNIQSEWIDLKDLSKVIVMFKSTSEHLSDDMVYVIDSTRAASHQGNEIFISHDFSGFEGAEQLLYNVNGEDHELWVDGNVSNIQDLVTEMNAARDGTWDATFFTDGNYVEIRSEDAGKDVYIKIYESTLGTRLGFRPGIYRGNDWNWNDEDALQKDFYQYIYIEDLGFVDNIPDGQWDIEIDVEYNESAVIQSYQTSYTEFTYKLTEIYRALIFEYIAKNFKDFEQVEQRIWTTLERTMYSILQFDAVYKAFVAALDVGNLRAANTNLSYLINYRQLNPVS